MEYKRDGNGRFVRGTAPGPGRPAGWARAFRRACSEDDVEEIVRALVSAAKAGDLKAAELILRRAVPDVQPTREEVLEELSASAEGAV